MYDCIIVGCGAAGFASGIYAQRYNLKSINLCKDIGGDISKAYIIENYPGFKEISGIEWSMKVKDHLEHLGGKIILGEASSVVKKNGHFEIRTNDGQKFQSKTLILASGMNRRKLAVAGADKFDKKGISYCVTCDGPLYKGKEVAVVGGGNAGVSAAIMMSNIAQKVYLIEAQPKLLAEEVRIEKLSKIKNAQIIIGRKITEIKGKESPEEIILDKPFAGRKNFNVQGIFVEIGSVPEPKIPQMLGLDLDKIGLIKVGSDQATNIAGVWAAGDVTNGSNKFRQLITAQAEGAIAANSVHKYLGK